MMRPYVLTLVFLVVALGQSCKIVKDDSTSKGDSGPGTDHAGSGAGRSAGSGGSAGRAGVGGATAGSDSDDAGVADVPPIDCTQLDAFAKAKPLPAASAGTLRLSGLVKLSGSPSLEGNIIIEAGTTLVMAADTSVEFGWNGHATSISALGTATRPIYICGEKAGPGFWRGLLFSDGVKSDTALEHVIVSGAGGSDVAVAFRAPVHVKDLTVRDSKNDGVSASGFGDPSSGLVVEGSGRDAIILNTPSAVQWLPTGSRFTGNKNNVARLPFDRLDGEIKFRDIGIPYVQEQSLDIIEGARLEFEAGVEYQLGADRTLEIGWNSSKVTLLVNGTEAKPVTFRAVDPASPFGSIWVKRTVTTDSKISHARILNGGAGNGVPLDIEAGITIEDVLVKDCATNVVISAALKQGSKNLSITGSATFPLLVTAGAVTSLPQGGTFTGNARDVIQFTTSGNTVTMTGKIPNLGVPYLLVSSVELGEGTDVEFSPGTEFVFQSGHQFSILVGWNMSHARLAALGTAAAPVVFRGENDEVGAWGGIRFPSTASTTSKLDYVQVKGAEVTLQAPITVTNSSFSKSPGYGILKNASNTMDYTLTNTFADNVTGNVGSQ
jgi:hypothetical protein